MGKGVWQMESQPFWSPQGKEQEESNKTGTEQQTEDPSTPWSSALLPGDTPSGLAEHPSAQRVG